MSRVTCHVSRVTCHVRELTGDPKHVEPYLMGDGDDADHGVIVLQVVIMLHFLTIHAWS